MKPAYWIGIFALAGGIFGYALFKWSGWFDSTTFIILGMMFGLVIYNMVRDKERR